MCTCLVLSCLVLSRLVLSCLVCLWSHVSCFLCCVVSCVRRCLSLCVCCLSVEISVVSWLWAGVSSLVFPCTCVCWLFRMSLNVMCSVAVFGVRSVRCAVCVWCDTLKKPAVCTFKTSPCVPAARSHVVTTCGLGAGTHGDFLRVTRTRTRNTHPRTNAHTQTHAQSHTDTHTHTENTQHAGHTQDKNNKFSDKKSMFF